MSDATRIRLCGYFIVVLLAFVVTVAFAIDGSDMPANSELSGVDEKILTEMFRGRVYLDDSGKPERMIITYGCPSMYGIDENHEMFEYFTRWRALYDAHESLMQEDPTYKKRFDALEQQLVVELGYYATQRDGRTRTFSLFSAAGIFQSIAHRAGSSELLELSQLPRSAMNDRWGSTTRAYSRGVDQKLLESTRESILPFHYCAGMRDSNNHGLTVSGGNTNPHVAAHVQLLGTDSIYREKFNAVVSAFYERALSLDPMDFSGSAALTRDFREALINAGVADAIEQVVSGGTVAVVNRTR